MPVSKVGTSAWGAMWVALLAFICSPGPVRSAFSGIALSSKATAILVMLVGVAVAMFIIRPARAPRPAWCIAILAAVALKIALASLLVTPGWHGQYFTGQKLRNGDAEALQPVMTRIDRELQYDGDTFGLDFINDLQRSVDFEPFVRDREQPLRVLWRGWTSEAANATAEISAAGLVIVRVNGAEAWRGVDPKQARVSLANIRQIEILYDKPRGVRPAIHIAGLPSITATSADRDALRNSNLASMAINALGIAVLLLFAAVVINAYRPFREVAARIDSGQLAMLAFTATFLIIGLMRSIPQRHTTIQLKIGDDFLNYEGMSRAILRGDVLLLQGREPGTGEPYYHYPLYPFALAATHFVFGDDFASVELFNYLCVALTGPLLAAFLRRHLPPRRLAAVIIALLLFAIAYFPRYTFTAFSDNLYLVTMFGALFASVRALESPRTWRFVLTGVLIALAAATRPSGFIFLPFFAIAILLQKEIGGLATRVKAIFATIAGFAIAVSPFTVRNRIVSGRWVMLVGGYMSITAFLYPPDIPQWKIPLMVGDRMPTVMETLHQVATVIRTDPGVVLWTEMRKVLFTFGWTGFGPGDPVPFFGLYPLLFIVALSLKRIPRPTAFVLVAFLVSHLASMVLAAPWTYGYKSILPFHLACIVGAAFLLKPRIAHESSAS
jgi:dolichyl-phosphate-mannose-protein mannosyltransferase